MATHGNYALRVPASLMEDLRVAADRDGVSLNGFIIQAIAEKVAVLRARGALQDMLPAEQSAYLEGRVADARPERLAQVLAKAGTTEAVLPDDEIPAGLLPP